MEQEEQNNNIGTITVVITEDEISYDSDLDIANIVFFLELTKELILKQSMEKNV